ncbi:hypothetical protein C2S53_008788 [Perilla frutescens var. hirtella]|uniref:Ty3 transposon capsid-like protein domain-containing protein n=1 Tax=Perilla frutescens var. hirtella TaxID=608512 RepID=A0AAD4ISM8_PERFH|nr:hypothetical protein C2S53_008788 [Perilla frutescens var. hirtella]
MLPDLQEAETITHIPLVEFPKFDGFHPLPWIHRCKGYFKLVPNISDNQKITIASMNFEGRAALWFQTINSRCGNVSWKQFVEVVAIRFEDLNESKIITEFNKLKYTGDYLDYVEKFEGLKKCMLLFGQGAYTENYFKACFISGLSYELRSVIHEFAFATLDQVMELGKNQLTTIDALTKKVKDVHLSYFSTWTNVVPTLTPQSSLNPTRTPENRNQPTPPPDKLLKGTYMAAKKAQELCYNCEEKLTPGHRCVHIITGATMTKEEELAFMESTREELMAAVNVFDPGKLELGKNQHTSKEAPTRKLKRNSRLSPTSLVSYPPHSAPMLFSNLAKENSPPTTTMKFLKSLQVVDRKAQWLYYNDDVKDAPIETTMEEVLFFPNALPNFSLINGILRYKSKLDQELRSKILVMKSDEKELVKLCEACKLNKPNPNLAMGLYLDATQGEVEGTIHKIRVMMQQLKANIHEDEERKKLIFQFEFNFRVLEELLSARGIEFLVLLKTDRNHKHWSNMLTLAEDRHIINYHTFLELTLFYALYGYPLPYLLIELYLDTNSGKVKDAMLERKEMISHLRENLLGAQNRIRGFADKFTKKLSEGITPLPELSEVSTERVFQLLPVAVLVHCTIICSRVSIDQILVQWEGISSQLQSWEDLKFTQKKFPTLDPWGQGFDNGGGSVVNMTTTGEVPEQVVAGEKRDEDRKTKKRRPRSDFYGELDLGNRGCLFEGDPFN